MIHINVKKLKKKWNSKGDDSFAQNEEDATTNTTQVSILVSSSGKPTISHYYSSTVSIWT